MKGQNLFKNAKTRFSNRVETYQKYRPSYPPELIEFVKTTCSVDSEWTVADIGSGTGISTEMLLKGFPCKVLGVEPNSDMRMAAESTLDSHERYKSIDGSSEATTLEDKSIEMIVSFQAFHWFELEKTKLEFGRVLRGPKWVLFVWNNRKEKGTPFLNGYDQLLRQLPDYNTSSHKNVDQKILEEFLGRPMLITKTFPNSQKFDLEGLKGRFFSSSYTPAVDDPQYEIQMEKLTRLFEATNENGYVSFDYSAEVFLGKMTE